MSEPCLHCRIWQTIDEHVRGSEGGSAEILAALAQVYGEALVAVAEQQRLKAQVMFGITATTAFKAMSETASRGPVH